MTAFIDHSVTELAAGLRAGAFSSVELTQAYLQRIESYNNALNAFVTTTAELALTQAAEADQLLRKNPAQTNPLTGIPLAHKDIFLY